MVKVITKDSIRERKAYEYGFVSDVAADEFPRGLSENIIREISRLKGEPSFLLDFRLKAYETWKKMEKPRWAMVSYEDEDFQKLRYFSAPKGSSSKPKSLEDIDENVLKTFERLGIPLSEQKRISGVAVDAVFDSVSVATTHREELAKVGVIFCSFSEAARDYPDLIKKYLGSVVPPKDNYYAALNSAVFSDGSFAFIPKGVRCP